MIADFHGASFPRSNHPDNWTESQIVKATKNNLLNKTCRDCEYLIRCNIHDLVEKTYNTCYSWEEYISPPSWQAAMQATAPSFSSMLNQLNLICSPPPPVFINVSFELPTIFESVKNIIKSKNKQKQVLIEIRNQTTRIQNRIKKFRVKNGR